MLNLRGLDEHLIMSGIGKIKKQKIQCIPNNLQKYISFSLGSLVFLDSLQFLNASLNKLVKKPTKGKVWYLEKIFSGEWRFWTGT